MRCHVLAVAGALFLILSLLSALALAHEKPWEKEWNRVLEAARKEGKVRVAGSPDPVMKNAIVPMFQDRFGIPVEFIAGRSSQIAARVRTERTAGVYTVDVFMAGGNTTVDVLYPEKMIDPLKPLLILPEVVDPSKWKRGKLWFIDLEEQFILRVFSSVEHTLHVNAEFVRPEEIQSAKDLLNPKWKGKISAEDPTTTGSGAARATIFYRQFGEEFVKRLYLDQNVTYSRERRQLADWLARGTHPICLNCRDEDVALFRKEGFKILEIYDLSDMRGTINAQPWLLTVGNKAPHPNAARIFVNWIASKDALETYSRGYGAATVRSDVDESFLKPESVPRPGKSYFDDTEWKWLTTGSNEARQRVAKLLKK